MFQLVILVSDVSYSSIVDNAKDEFVLGIISEYEKGIIEFLNNYIEKKEWKLTLAGLEIRKLTDEV